VKISDKELRDRTMMPKQNVYAIVDVLAGECLSLRAEVRRLRKALRAYVGSHSPRQDGSGCLCVGCEALARRGGRKWKR